MTDQQLLELAAKAAGFLNWTATEPAGLHIETGSSRGDTGFYWNPLVDDGDALRLAVKLGINITSSGHSPIGIPFVYAQKLHYRPCQEYGDDTLAATRRAIVRAAAAIAKATGELNV